ncbi:MAG: hypothetical protein HUJ76_04840 [Parasporobacterium sp.]|nr:hypothetical protein [Holdemanella sp.]MCF0229002.1 hypothetical protein [Parasporobacterium sp.]
MDIAKTIMDLLREILWGAFKALTWLINMVLDSTINGVLGFDIITNNDFISSAFTTFLALMPLIIVTKISYEVVKAMILDDEQGMQLYRKLASAVLGMVLAVSTQYLVVYANNLVKQTCTILATTDFSGNGGASTNVSGEGEQQLADPLILAVLQSFGGMSTGTDAQQLAAMDNTLSDGNGAGDLVHNYNLENNNFDINEMKNGDYRWQVNWMVLVGMLIYLILLFIVMLQMALRMIAIAFYYVITPLCCTSLTNYQNPQAFTIWKNSFLGQWLMNITQMFLLVLFMGIISDIGSQAGNYPLAQCALMFGAISLVITAPNFVQAMIGGYGAGIMETLNQMRSVGSVMGSGVKAAAGFAAGVGSATLGGGIAKAVAGTATQSTDPSTGAVTRSRAGGLAGAVLGSRSKTTGKDGSNISSSSQGGLAGALFGNRSYTAGADGSTTSDRVGGLAGAFAGDFSSHTDSDGVTSTVRSGGLAGAVTGTRTTLSSGDDKQTVNHGGIAGIARRQTITTFNNGAKTVSRDYRWGLGIKKRR